MKKFLGIVCFSTILAAPLLAEYTITNALAHFPKTYPKITYLNLSNKGIDSWKGLHLIPIKYPNLKTLDLSGNKLDHIPNVIDHLLPFNSGLNLDVVDLSHNKIKKLNTSIIAFGFYLKKFDLRGNPLNDITRAALYRVKSATSKYDKVIRIE